jgi:hypothetical protein
MSESSARDFDEAKEDALEESLAEADPGDQATAQTEGEIDHPHGEDNHTDFTIGTKEDDGSVSFEKGHGSD